MHFVWVDGGEEERKCVCVCVVQREILLLCVDVEELDVFVSKKQGFVVFLAL